ncbi:MAG TPA: DUF4446 family protein [Candidatus Paceibacterota bacterium]
MIINTNIMIYALTILVLVLLGWLIKNEIRMKRLMAGKKASDLEEVLMTLVKDLDGLQKSKNKIETDINKIEDRLRKSIRGLSTVRFNPFKDSGGNQSFAIALLNDDGDGVIISSLYSRERMSVFAKPVKSHVSEYDLTKEESEALTSAKL